MTALQNLRNKRLPAAQRGAALFVLLVALGLAAALFVGYLVRNSGKLEVDEASATLLAQAKDALIGYAVSPTAGGQRPGDLPRPDAASEGPGNYDGHADGGCLDVTKANGLPLIGGGPANGSNLRCLGRLPWSDLGMTIQGASENDPTGIMPWYAVSANLVDPLCLTVLNSDATTLPTPAFAGNSYAQACASTSQMTHPWLTVRDANGNVISNRVAVVLIIPGAPLAGQNRPTSPNLAGPSAYLDSVTVPAGCAAPCVPGAYSNADMDNDFIVGSQSGTFNDKVLYVTIDELMAAVEKRVATEAGNGLAKFYNFCGFYPYPVNFFSDACYTGTCPSDAARTQGRFPYTPKPNGAAASFPEWTSDFDAATAGVQQALPQWFLDNRWDRVLYYTPGSGFVVGGSGSCGAGGCLSVDGASTARSLFFTPRGYDGATARPTKLPRLVSDYLATTENNNLDTAFTALNTLEKLYRRSGDTSPYTPSSPNPACTNTTGGLVFGTVGGTTNNSTSSNFTTTTPSTASQVSIDTTTGAITLGNTHYDAGNTDSCQLYACVWYNNSLAFGNGVSVYFSFVVNDPGDGFTFAVIDADRNSTTNCGQGGEDLGYSGVNLCAQPSLPWNFATYPPVITWAANTQYRQNTFIKPTPGSTRIYMSGDSGTSGASAPSWPTDYSSVNDNSVSYWWDMGPIPMPAWAAKTYYNYKYIYVTPTPPNGRFYQTTQAGTSGASQPAWPTNYGTVADGGTRWQDMGFLPTPPVYYPKIGIEFDTYRNSGGPNWVEASRKIYYSGRNDPSYSHSAIIYWGNSQANYSSNINPSRREDFEDNYHDASNNTLKLPYYDPISQPPTQIDSLSSVGRIHHVRVDISRSGQLSNANGTYRNYTTKVWIVAENNGTYNNRGRGDYNFNLLTNPCLIGKMQNTSQDFDPTYTRPAAWSASTAYAKNDCVSAGNRDYIATNAGTSGAFQPTWPAGGTKPSSGLTVTDGTITWQDTGAVTWTPVTHYADNDITFPTNFTAFNDWWYVTSAGTSDTSEPNWKYSGTTNDGSGGGKVQWKYGGPIFGTNPANTAVMSDTVKIYDIMGQSPYPRVDLGEAFKNFRFGFTQGQGGVSQSLVIQGMKANLR
jgi:hypothetical protein